MRQGGSYIKDKTGKVKLVHRTGLHPDGNAPRDADGTRLDLPVSEIDTLQESVPKNSTQEDK